MNFEAATAAMRNGHEVARTATSKRTYIDRYGIPPIVDVGVEPMRLAAAWTHDNKPVSVFQGARSLVLFVPSADDVAATDWEIVT